MYKEKYKLIRAVIFDMDGTLIDTEKYYQEFWPKALAEFGYEITKEQTLSIRSLGRPFAPQRFREWYGDDFDYIKVREKRKELMNARLAETGIDLKPGAVEILSFLKENGIAAAVATASDMTRTEKYLDEAGIKHYFTKLISATMVEKGKPAPDIYKYACAELGLPPEECMAVEDAPNGIISAGKAGCKVVMVPDMTGPDSEVEPYLFACVDRLDDIIGLLTRENRQ